METMIASSLIEQLRALVDPGQVLTDPDALRSYGCDWTRLYEPAPSAVVLPKSTEQVQAIVKLANENRIGLVPSGGRTGLNGGAVAGRRGGRRLRSHEPHSRIRRTTARCAARPA